MEKIILIGFYLLNSSLSAQEVHTVENTLEKDCLSCHREQQIPSSLLYKRYLMTYSTKARMEEAMFDYLKDPKKENSIMPSQFFLKFPMKKRSLLDNATLHKDIQNYLKEFDIRKKLLIFNSQ